MLTAIIFANGTLPYPDFTLRALQREAAKGEIVVIAADGGGRHCLELGIEPHWVIGDLDSLTAGELAQLQANGARVLRYPARKSFTDLELALQHAASLKAEQILVFGALGARWDQTLANLLLPAAPGLENIPIRLLDGPQEIVLLRPGGIRTLSGCPGDTVSLIPLAGPAHGITTRGLEYPLQGETLYFGATRGISNVLLESQASVSLAEGLLLCVLIHQES